MTGVGKQAVTGSAREGVTPCARHSHRRLLTAPCLACDREAWTIMCELCSDLEAAEERAADHDEPQRGNDADD